VDMERRGANEESSSVSYWVFSRFKSNRNGRAETLENRFAKSNRLQ